MRVINKQHSFATDLFRRPTFLAGFSTVFEVKTASHLIVNGHVNLHHRGLVDGAVGYGCWLGLRREDTLEDLGTNPSTLDESYGLYETIKGSTDSGNIADVAQHYGTAKIDGYKELEKGFYRLCLFGVSHSDLSLNSDGLINVLIEGGEPLNNLIIQLHDK